MIFDHSGSVLQRHEIRLTLGILVGLGFLLGFGHWTTAEVAGETMWHTTDDHMITQRVAYMMWHYGVPYYNPSEPVAASTSLIWPILLSPLYAVFSLQSVMPVVIGLSLGLTLAALGLAIRALAAPVIAVCLCFFLFRGVTVFAPSGVEQIPQMLGYTLACITMLRANAAGQNLLVPNQSMVFLAVVFLLRPDAAPAIAPFLVAWLATDGRVRRWDTLGWIVAGFCLLAFYFAAMWVFYQDLVPNTAYLKLDFGWDTIKGGLRYVLAPWRAGPVPLTGIVLLLLWRYMSASERLIFGSVFCQGVYVVAIGGDFFNGGRFFLMVMPIMLSLVFAVSARVMVAKRGDRLLRAALTLLLVLVPGYPHFKSAVVHQRLPYLQVQDRQSFIGSGLHVMAHIRDRLAPKDGSIGLNTAGLAYHVPDFHVVDFLGKAEPHIARLPARPGQGIGHNKFDFDYAYQRYDIAVSLVADRWAQHAQKYIADEIRPKHWSYLNLGPISALEHGYVLLSPDEMGIEGRVHLLVRPDLLERLR